MKLRLVAVGRLRDPSVAALAHDLRRRLPRYGPFEETEVDAAHGGDPARAVRDEGQRVLRALPTGEPMWLLERTGTQLSSPELAARLADEAHATSRLTLVVAGAFGASEALLERATFRWSLSRLTLLHEWARLLVLEQLYRAAKISRNEPYHH
ncbi:MAG: 23S rRNA (pseudouridine(1915)-N(3))-methyltransferase RlmH [Candidatus Eremiobacteraeota bacterium]|nr:23S rRNA (pseudouridine(1915)-N(3))-methyltransferase RlmH [Candidatus Eremiobacteraeota bacterium]MBC5803980.1 23S rRNA (pseudouridine(1915)-N(3))-methyltransferase RlmH [Candidatus Eremiobacteraeota bacterium]MBC5820367.1 23S rRNA (pseudouridine(1915)-N(3))-methyltransferase RlmH [Candidatus Eremiobacteraeota bacterium]